MNPQEYAEFCKLVCLHFRQTALENYAFSQQATQRLNLAAKHFENRVAPLEASTFDTLIEDLSEGKSYIDHDMPDLSNNEDHSIDNLTTM
jgi:hypothetical protein